MYNLKDTVNMLSKVHFQKDINKLNVYELHSVVALAVKGLISNNIRNSRQRHKTGRRAYYFSAEFLLGRLIYNNLFCCGKFDELKKYCDKENIDFGEFEVIEDAALGNGGLGRLAACFLDSAATCNLPVDGYGIRYKYGLFKQNIVDGFQTEEGDDWTKFGDPWSDRKEFESVTVKLGEEFVKAVPYDIAVLGYGSDNISILRLWQCEALEEFDFESFNNGKYKDAVSKKNTAEDISRVLYPNDSTDEGKLLRLKQQYFFTSASLQDIIGTYKKTYGNSYIHLSDKIVIQLNDTHPVIAVPELIRLLMKDGESFEFSLNCAKKVFRYTNHTVMQEALEKWHKRFIIEVAPEIYDIIEMIHEAFETELDEKKIKVKDKYKIITDDTVNMAHLACYCSSYINGVAKLHTEIIKNDVLSPFYYLYPEKFKNVTNGITQRRWLGLCNESLSKLISELLGSREWLKELTKLKELEKYADSKEVIDRFISAKGENKKKLKRYLNIYEGVNIDENAIIDVQIKRLHEYKRQLLNILTILEIYFEIKEGSLKDFHPTVFIFGAKAAPGYTRAKGIIKLINEISEFIEKDDDVKYIIKVVFVTNYDVSYAEKIIAAAEVSQQISTAGTEASGTGNMKLMLNGAVTMGTFDGANIEIVNESGTENNYIFGADVEELDNIRESYDPLKLYEKDKRIKRCLDCLVDGTLDDGDTGYFKDLYDSLLTGADWHSADNYFVLYDFDSYLKTRIRMNNEYKDKYSFYRKCYLNMCNAGIFSSDRAIMEYADEIWQIK